MPLHWAPSCPLSAIKMRAQLNRSIRTFFEDRGVLEVETPLLSWGTVTDPALTPFKTAYHRPGSSYSGDLYLQTSPEFAMKRLLAGGSGSIYQIVKAFRNEEQGRYHNPEFSLLEWYRVDFGLDQLIDEVEALILMLAASFGKGLTSRRISYQTLFLARLQCDPLESSFSEFQAKAEALGLPEASHLCGEDRATWLDLLFGHFIQPDLGRDALTVVIGYPAILPSLARSCPHDPRYVERAELFLAGMELGNGFHELRDPNEQRQRFERDLERRQNHGQVMLPMDQRLLEALRVGLPACSGMAIGLDRLLMALIGSSSLEDVLGFPIERA
ncbi:MAG: EF-P lysine aminoacylase EpmA [Methylococcaceae bacterium]